MLAQEQLLRNPPDRFSEGSFERERRDRRLLADLTDGERYCGTLETHCSNALQTLRLVLPEGAKPRVGYDYGYRMSDVPGEPGRSTRTLMYMLGATVGTEVIVQLARTPGDFAQATSILKAKCELALKLAGKGATA